MTPREQELAKKLTQLAPQVTGKMAMEAALDVAISYPTVKKYLKGEVGKEAVAEKLFNFLETKLTVAA